MYSYEEVYTATLEYFYGNELLTDIWINKYTLKDKKGNYYELTPDERLKTISKEITRIELKYNSELNEIVVFEKIYNLLKDFNYFIPGGSIMYGLGNKQFLSSLGNCFVIGNKTDSYGSICKIDEEQVQLMKRRGGVGHDLSHLRPKGVPVNGCANTSTGSISFASRYSHSTREVAQDGRRGALMLTHHINHPDVLDFITLKDDTSKVTGANISVKVTDEFMNNVLSNGEHKFKFPINSEKEHSKTNAKDLFNKLIHQAWKNGEPGVLFWDKIIKESPADCYDGFETRSTNPCGELPLSPYDSCRLGHINLFAYIENPFSTKAYFNESKFKEDVLFVQRIMDNIIDLEGEKINDIIYQIETSYDDIESKRTELNLWNKIKNSLISGRRTGLGMLGDADAVAALGMVYSNSDANEFIIKAHKILALKSYESSIIMAKERGCFPFWNLEKEKNNPFIDRILSEFNENYKVEKGQENPLIWEYEKYGRRNISNLTIAPTGTVAQLSCRCGVSSGIEPVFEIFYKRRRKINSNDKNIKVDFIDEVGDKWTEYYIIHPIFKKWYETINNSRPLEEYSENELKELIKHSPYHKAVANEIDVISKIKLQGEVQKWVDHSISITHNLPKETTEEQISEYFIEAWMNGCKGITVYREGSRTGVLIKNEMKQEGEEIFSYTDAKPRPEILNCEIHRLQSRGQYFFVLVGILSSNPYEIFVIDEKQFPSCLRIAGSQILKGQIIKRKSRNYDLITARPDNNEPLLIKDLVSLMSNDDDKTDTKRFSLELRHRISPKEIAETIEKSCGDITAFEKVIARVLRKYIKEGEVSRLVCTKCGSKNMTYSGGCLRCKDCGDSKCS